MESYLVEAEEFFAPTSTTALDSLIAGYNADKAKLERFVGVVDNEVKGVLHHFDRRDGNTYYKVPEFKVDKAILSLNATYWTRALQLTDVLEMMPQERRNKWHEQLRAWEEPRYERGKNPDLDLPDFTEDIVKESIRSLLLMRSQFFAERVDGLFRNLSKTHVTNQPEGFSKRMIIAGILSEWGSTDWTRVGYISDLRSVVAKFMGRDEPNSGSTDAIVRAAKEQRGEWLPFDGGALRIRVYKVGTAHLEIHPDMAWRLNSVLASIHPMAIPSQFRTKPAKKTKDFQMMQRPLPFSVLAVIENGSYWNKSNYRRVLSGKVYEKELNSFEFKYDAKKDTPAFKEAVTVLESLGGVYSGGVVRFDYDPGGVIGEVVRMGCIPDHKSHQYYPTPEALAQKAVGLAEIKSHHSCLEPSAGRGGLADYLPKDNTDCIEVSELNHKVLESKGFNALNADFLAWKDSGHGYDRIVMNPPYSEGRWKLHLEHAAGMVAEGGRLVAILPASAKDKHLLVGFSHQYHGPYDNEFSGTNISVVILVADKQG